MQDVCAMKIDHLDGVMYVDKATEMMQIDKEDDEA